MTCMQDIGTYKHRMSHRQILLIHYNKSATNVPRTSDIIRNELKEARQHRLHSACPHSMFYDDHFAGRLFMVASLSPPPPAPSHKLNNRMTKGQTAGNWCVISI